MTERKESIAGRGPRDTLARGNPRGMTERNESIAGRGPRDTLARGNPRGMTRRTEAWLIQGALIAAAIVTLFPLVWMISVSLMSPGEASASPPPLLPSAPTLANYRELFRRGDITRNLVNSLGVAIAATLLSLAFNVSAGYAFAKLKFAGRDLVWKLLLGVMLIPAQVAMIPLFLMLKQLGLINSYAGVLIPSIANVFGIFLVRQYALSLPDELIEAARIDGAGEPRIFWSIVLPVLRPVLVTLAIFAFLGAWNDFLWPLIILADHGRQTLPVALAALAREHAGDSELMMAGAVITIVPVLAVFLALQRYYLQGLLTGSVKG
ncbi:MAG TPA: carbohydrate ABC transporter permease [Kofleriaceae bacterium]|jgi:multiple sugar transport system permease protein|nr:carbohydrate ABC transporter permease [Kofleriaceae bacterium]